MGVERGSAGCLFFAALPRPSLLAMSTPLVLRDRARRLRREQTDAERRLWMHLRRHQLGVQFRPPASDRSVHRGLLLCRTHDGGRA